MNDAMQDLVVISAVLIYRNLGGHHAVRFLKENGYETKQAWDFVQAIEQLQAQVDAGHLG